MRWRQGKVWYWIVVACTALPFAVAVFNIDEGSSLTGWSWFTFAGGWLVLVALLWPTLLLVNALFEGRTRGDWFAKFAAANVLLGWTVIGYVILWVIYFRIRTPRARALPGAAARNETG